MWKSDIFYIQINKTLSSFKNLNTGKAIEISSSGIFDHPRSLAHDFKKTSIFIAENIKKLSDNQFVRPIVILDWIGELEGGGFSSIEKTLFKEILHKSQARKVTLLNSIQPLTDSELKKYY